MANFVSIEGKWFPRKERAVIVGAEEGKEIYDGDDRDALKLLEENEGELGQDFRIANEEIVMRARNVGCDSIDEYLKMYHNYNSVEKRKELEAIRNLKVKGSVNEYPNLKKGRVKPMEINDIHNHVIGEKPMQGGVSEATASVSTAKEALSQVKGVKIR